jgi:alkylhydroperoxidase family enzyme
MKTQMSRFQIHDDLSAPEESVPLLRSAMAGAGQLPNFRGVLAGSPSALRAYTRFRGELRHGTLPRATLERIALAIADHYGSAPGIALHSRTARQEKLGLDEVALARTWSSQDPKEHALLTLIGKLVVEHHSPPAHFVEEAREAGWTDEQLLEAIAFTSLESFTAMVNVAGDVPVDGSVEESRTLRAA